MTKGPGDQESERKNKVAAIVDSGAGRKLVVAGPGTGKSYTFHQVLKARPGNNLALTFINLLAADLDRALAGLADAKTFHGFCRALLHKSPGPGLTTHFAYYPPLVLLQAEDWKILGNPSVERTDIEQRFHQLETGDGIIGSALKSGDTYDAVGHVDSVYRVLRAFEYDSSAVPQFAQIVVDEFQDFSELEVAFIKYLAHVSPTLLAGDDDQALYGFKGASPDFIRNLVADGEWETFELPYCSRCTAVLVDAVHDVVANAQAIGLLKGRIAKRYECFLPEKQKESLDYPAIIHAKCSVDRKGVRYPARYIARAIAEIPSEHVKDSWERGEPTALVLGPSHLLDPIHEMLRTAYQAVTFRRSEPPPVDRLDGLRYLIEDSESVLGWRILLHTEKPDGWEEFVRAALNGASLVAALPPDFRKRWLDVCLAMQGLRAGEAPAVDVVTQLREALALDVPTILRRMGWVEPEAEPEPDTTQPSVVLTTLTGAKGLQARHVFVVGFNEGQFPKQNARPTDLEVCQLIVALTRAKSQCTLVSADNYAGTFQAGSVFLRWLARRISAVRVDRNYF